MNPGRSHFDVPPISNEATKKAFRDRAAADISGTNKEDAFHGSRRASGREIKVGLNEIKSTFWAVFPSASLARRRKRKRAKLLASE